MDTRVNWDALWMSIASVVSHRSKCENMKVGAVIVGHDNRILATGYNGAPAGFPDTIPCPREQSCHHRSDYSDCYANHAEVNAILYSDRSLRQGGTIYITAEPCFSCARILASSGLKRVVVMGDQSRGNIDFLETAGLVVDIVEPFTVQNIPPELVPCEHKNVTRDPLWLTVKNSLSDSETI